MQTEYGHAPATARQTQPCPTQLGPTQRGLIQLGVTQALAESGIAFFDYRPDWARDASGYSGAWHWTGARFGIDGVEAPDGASCLVDAAVDDDLPGLIEAFGLEHTDSPRAAEFRVFHPDSGAEGSGAESSGGKTIHLLCDVQCDVGADGRPASLFGTVQDVTRQRRAEAALIESARHDHVVLAAVDVWPVGIGVADATRPDLPLIYVNRQFARMTGYASGELIGRGLGLLRGPATDPDVMAGLAAAIARGARAEARLVGYRKDGTSFLDRVILEPIHGQDGKLIAYMSSHADITPDREDAAGEGMLGAAARQIHDMLRPVTRLAQDAIGQGLVAEAGREHLDILLECSRKARHVIGALLAPPRAAPRLTSSSGLSPGPSADRCSEPRPEPREVETHDPVSLLNDGLRLVRQAIPSEIRVRLQIDGRPPPVTIERTRFAEILLNLATNAAAAMPEHGTLTIALDEDSPDGAARVARLRVIDGGGMGGAMAAADADTMAADAGFTARAGGLGTGLGFPLVCGMVRAAGGHIALSSDPGGGTTATVLLPGPDRAALDKRGENAAHANA